MGGHTGSAWFSIVRHSCRAAGFDPRTLLSSDDYRAVQAFVAAGLGVALIPGLAVARARPASRCGGCAWARRCGGSGWPTRTRFQPPVCTR